MEKNADSLSTRQKAEIFDALVTAEYENLIRIDPSSGEAVTVYAADGMWKESQGQVFVYENMIRQYLMNVSVDTDPEALLQRFVLEEVKGQLAKAHYCHVFFIVRGKDGLFNAKQASFFPTADGFIMLAIHDISDGYQVVSSNMEHLRSALTEAQQEIRQKNTFLSMLNENLRTPLYSIMGLTRIAEENPYRNSFDDYLHKISISGSYMQETIDDVLSLRQIASHQLNPNPVIIQLKDFFSNIERMIRPSIYGKGLLFKADVSNVADLEVLADSRILQQIVLKMLRSAIGYTVRGGRIRLYARTLRISGENVSLELFVENRGIVIDQERLSVLFKPYDYLKDRLSQENGDLDIALIILRSNLLAIGCDTITAESDEQRGTRISVMLNLPLGGPVPDTDTDREMIPEFTGKRVLVVDDNDISLEVSEKLLFNKGVEVVKAHSGKEAISEFVRSNGDFDLILMDILMPEMSGLEAARKIRAMKEIPSASTVPIIALTINAFLKNFEESLAAGMNEHIVKPIDPDSFYQILMKYLKYDK